MSETIKYGDKCPKCNASSGIDACPLARGQHCPISVNTLPAHYFDIDITTTPRVDACIEAVMAKHPGFTTTEHALYYEAVHQVLAPLARQLELELARASRAVVERESKGRGAGKNPTINPKSSRAARDVEGTAPPTLSCECLSWARIDGRLTNHHLHCKHFKEEIYAKVSLDGGSPYTMTMATLQAAVDADLQEAEAGTKLTIELVKMTAEEYDALADFQGH